MRVPEEMCAYLVHGRIAQPDGQPLADTRLVACPQDDSDCAAEANSITDDDGLFAALVPQRGDYHLSVNTDGICPRYYRHNDQRISVGNEDLRFAPSLRYYRNDRLIKLGQPDVARINIQLPPNVCGSQIRGRVVTTSGAPRAGVIVAAHPHGGNSYTMNRTASDGSFILSAPEPGEYRLRLHLTDHCRPYYSPDWTTVANFVRSLITVGSADVNDILIEVPEGLCERQITGRIMLPDGQPLADKEIGIRLGDDVPELRTDHNGSFAIAVPTDGEYQLFFDLEQGCTVYVNSDGFTTRHWDRVRVEGQDTHLGLLQIPGEVCRQITITGRITAPDGQPHANTDIEVCRWTDAACEHHAWQQTDYDGSFAITVPADSSYSLSTWIIERQHSFYFSSDGFAADPEERPIVRVEGDDVHLGTIQTPAG